jgi:hypothetical protein
MCRANSYSHLKCLRKRRITKALIGCEILVLEVGVRKLRLHFGGAPFPRICQKFNQFGYQGSLLAEFLLRFEVTRNSCSRAWQILPRVDILTWLKLTPIGGSAPIGDSARTSSRSNNYSTVSFKSVVSQTSAENSETGTRSKDGQF